VNLSGAHVVVTGASRGIGEAISRQCATRGARVTALARSEVPLAALAADTGAMPVIADLADLGSLDGLIARIEDANGPIDVWVNNAAFAKAGPFVDLTAQELLMQVATNLHAPLELARQVLPRMVERNRGKLVTISSIAGELAFPSVAGYASTKAGLNQFSVNIKRELARTEVTTLLVILGEVETKMTQDNRADPALKEVAKRLGKLAPLEPNPVAAAVAQAIDSDRDRLVMPWFLRPTYAYRQGPNRLTDLAMRGIV
jgi:short-subunit dehydrogenase